MQSKESPNPALQKTKKKKYKNKKGEALEILQGGWIFRYQFSGVAAAHQLWA